MATTTVATASAPGLENQAPQAPWRENLNIHMICPDCKIVPPDLVEDNADTICANCGRVLAERLISYESEWRTFSNDEKGGEDPNRVGDVESDLFHGNQGTTIGGSGPNMSKETRRLRKAQAAQNEDKHNRALQSAYSEIDLWADSEHFPRTVKDTAKGFYKTVYDAQVFRGKNTKAILAGCLFIACRTNNIPRSFAEVMNLTKVPKKEIGRTFKQLNEFLQKDSDKRIKQIEDEGGIVNTESQAYRPGGTSGKPSVLLGRFCGMLGMPFRIQSVATRVAEKADAANYLAGRSPLSSAGAAMYFASHLLGMGRSLPEIAAVASVSDATIKQAYRKLYEHRDALIEPDWLGEQSHSLKEHIKTPLVGNKDNLPKVA